MNSKSRWWLILCAAAVLSAPVFATGEILDLKSGAAMPILSHEVKGDMIHVDLGNDSTMAFPMSMVDSIEKAGRNVLLEHMYRTTNNRMAGGAQGGKPLRTQPGIEKRDRDPNVDINTKTGMAVYRPHASSDAPNRRRIGLWGNSNVLRRGNADGYARQGNKILMPGSDEVRVRQTRIKPTMLSPKPPFNPPQPVTPAPGATPAPETPKQELDGSGGGQGDS